MTSKNKGKLTIFETASKLEELVNREVHELEKKTELDKEDIVKLFNLAKTHTALMGDLRDNLKTDAIQKLKSSE